MLELLFCALLTILPDFLVRRFVQGKRLGREITITSVWYELRWGITACIALTVTLITIVFFYHPSSTSAVSYFRTVPILSEGSGRVKEVFVGFSQDVKAGDPLFSLDATAEEARVQTARRQVAEIEAALVVAETERAIAQGRIDEARSAVQQAVDELDSKTEIRSRNADVVTTREIERLENLVAGRQGALDAAQANLASAEAKIAFQLPAQRESALAALSEAEVALSKMVVYAGVDGRIEQFLLRPGDIVNPFMRPAGLLIPADAGRAAIQAGFNQIEAPVIRPGMIGEATCISMPFQVISLVVTDVQQVIASGQISTSDRLVDAEATARAPGSLTVFMEPLFENEFDALLPGSSCIANIYTDTHARLASPDVGTWEGVWLHGVDAVGVVHAMLLRFQALLLPVRTLVFSGGH